MIAVSILPVYSFTWAFVAPFHLLDDLHIPFEVFELAQLENDEIQNSNPGSSDPKALYVSCKLELPMEKVFCVGEIMIDSHLQLSPLANFTHMGKKG